MRQEQRKANLQRLRHPVSTVDVFIDELILHGFSHADRYAIGDAISLELEHQLSEASVLPFLEQSADIEFIKTTPIALPRNEKPIGVGNQIGQAVFNGMKNDPQGRRR
jgi:hypothetical protein